MTNYSLYFVTDQTLSRDRLLYVTEQAILGGATCIQFRDKTLSVGQMVALGRHIRLCTQKYKVQLIINDRVDVALAVNADGVHLGQSDIPLLYARKLLGRKKIIGASIKTIREALDAQKEGADYLGVGPLWETNSKHDAGKALGLARLSQIVKAVSIPVVGIGGITINNAASVIKAGASGVAVISAISKAKNPKKAAEELFIACHYGFDPESPSSIERLRLRS